SRAAAGRGSQLRPSRTIVGSMSPIAPLEKDVILDGRYPLYKSAASIAGNPGQKNKIGKGRGVPLWGCQRHLRARRAVERAIAQHGKQDVAAPSCERDEGWVVTLSLADLAGVVGPGDRIAQSGEGRQEHRAL